MRVRGVVMAVVRVSVPFTIVMEVEVVWVARRINIVPPTQCVVVEVV